MRDDKRWLQVNKQNMKHDRNLHVFETDNLDIHL